MIAQFRWGIIRAKIKARRFARLRRRMGALLVRIARGFLGRLRFRRYKAEWIRRDKAARKIQRLGRVVVAKQVFERVRFERVMQVSCPKAVMRATYTWLTPWACACAEKPRLGSAVDPVRRSWVHGSAICEVYEVQAAPCCRKDPGTYSNRLGETNSSGALLSRRCIELPMCWTNGECYIATEKAPRRRTVLGMAGPDPPKVHLQAPHVPRSV